MINSIKHRITSDSILSRFCLVSLILLIVGGFSTSAWGAKDNKGTITILSGKGKVEIDAYYKYFTSEPHVIDSTRLIGVPLTVSNEKHNTDDGWVKFTATPNAGYSFYGWCEKSDCSDEIPDLTNPKTWSASSLNNLNVVRYTKFTPISYTVTLAKNDGSGATQAVTATYDAAMPSTLSAGGAIVAPTRTNYTFLGYFDAAEGGTKYYNADLSSAHIWDKASTSTLYAHWAPNYEVAFDKNGGQGSDMANQSFYYGEAAKALSTNTYTRSYTVSYDKVEEDATCSTGTSNTSSDYTFDGWATASNGNKVYNDGATVQNLSSTAGATVTLYAHWSGGSVTLPSATLEDHVLEGWYSNSAYDAENWIGEAGESYAPTDNVKLFAKWIEKHTPIFTGPSYVGDYYEMDVDDTYSGFTFNHVSDSVAVISDDKVISYNKATNTLTALKEGTATIKFTQTENDTLLEGTSATWSIRVSLVSNTLALNSSSDTKYVGQEVTNVRDLESQNSNATVQTSSSAPGIAHYDVANNKIVIDNAGDSSFVSKSVTITIWQAATAKYAASGDKTFTLTVNRYTPSFTGSNYNGLKVDDVQTADYSYSNVSADAPTNNANDDFYYTIENIAYDSIELNKKYNSLDSLVRFDPTTKKITALNAGECDIVFHQKKTRSINAGTSSSFHITVSKYDNTLYANSSASYSVSTYVDRTLDSILLTATNTDYANCPISVTQTRATNDTVSYGYNASTRKVGIRTHEYLTTAAWSLHQNENYKYKEADGSFSVTVGAVAEATDCYVKTDLNTEHEFRGDSWELKWDDEDAAGYLSFEAKAEAAWTYGLNVFQLINGSWDTVEPKYFSYDQLHTSYHPYGFQLDKRAKGVKFERTGTLRRWIKNVYVKRTTYLTAEEDTISISKTAGNNPVYPNDVAGAGRLIVKHSLANGGALKIANNNPSRFTLAKSTISDVDCKTAKDTIAISYTPIAEGHDTAKLVIYNDVYRDTVIVAGVCVKRNQHGEWKENISTLEIGTKVGNPYSSTRSLENEVTYRSSNTDYLEVNLAGDTILAKAKGSARLYVTVAGDDDYYALEDSIDITVTDKKVQYIVWGDGMAKTLRRLHVGDSRVLLDAKAMSNIDTCSTNGKRPITFVSRNTSIANVVTEDGKSYLTITSVKANAGETWIVASQAGGDDGYHDYIPVSDSLQVIVRDPDAICEVKYLYNFNDSTHLVDGNESGVRNGALYDGSSVYINYEGKSDKTRTTNRFVHAPSYAYWYAKRDSKGTGTLTVEQYIPSESRWVAAKSVTSFVQDEFTLDEVALRSDARQVRIILDQNKANLYVGGLQVVMASYKEVVEGGAVRDTLVFSSYIGTPQVKDLKLRWFLRRDMHLILPEGAPFTLSDDVFDRVCENDTTDLRITFNTMVGQTDSCYYLVFSDGVENGFRDTVVLKATATAEEITFTGGDWSKTPNKYKVANVAAGESLTISTEVEMYSLNIASGASVTVTPTGGLSVGAGGIANSSINKIKLESNSAGMTGYIRISPDYTGTMPEADVELFTKAYYNKAVAHSAKMQYIGVPVDKENYAAKDIFKTKSYVYSWSESKGQWVNNKNSLKVKPFTGYSITQYDESDGKVVEFSGSLLAPKDTTIELAYSGVVGAGLNFLANSYAAPIDISQFSYSDFSLEDEDDESVDYAIYLFNTGSKGEYEGGDPEDVTAAGQYITVSPGSVMRLRGLDDNYPIVIPSMQGFFVRTTEAGKSLKLDYNKLIWNADYSKRGNEKLRVQGRASEENTEETEEELGGAMKISLYSDIAVDHMYLLESDDYSKGYENGYDGRKMMAGELNVYAVEGEEALAVDATNDLEGTIIGVRTGSSDAYTLAFSRVQNVENLFLLDSENGQTMRIEEGATYTFYAAPDCDIDSRFEIIGLGGQGVFTNIGNDKNETKAVKYIKDNTMYILKNGVKYTSLGQKVE